MSTFWDARYDTDVFVYGKEPNRFFASELGRIPPGKILLPGDGEGRNAVFAARQGWEVDAFDQSQVAMLKALSFATELGVRINYTSCELQEYPFRKGIYDAVGLIFFHVPPPLRQLLHEQITKALKPGGKLILEAFHTSQLGNSTGGPQSTEMLFTAEILKKDFSSLKQELLEETELDLDEGPFHRGTVSLVRYIGTK
jgi:SAM-dependent methyltransferase